MATLNRHVVLLGLALAGCDSLTGFNGEAPPFATIRVQVSGDFEAVRAPMATNENLRVGLVWGEQWLPEALCFLPPESPEVAAVVAAGCRNPLSFTPVRVTESEPLVPGGITELSLAELPSADLMVGDLTARVGFASIVVFDDRDRDGTLQLARTRRLPQGGNGHGPDEPDEPEPITRDLVYGASFVAMSEPDTRLAFREGDFIETGFYPRRGCDAPLPAFSLVSAGGFSFAAALAATAAGMLPSEDPATCSEVKPEDAIVTVPFRPNTEVREVGCEQRREDSSVRYRQPPDEPLDIANLTYACAKIPSFGTDGAGSTNGIIQLVVAPRPEDTCKGLTHYTLFGCNEETTFECDAPRWDYRANPPAWWPCPAQ